MAYQTAYFELHAGFPDDSRSASAAERFLQKRAGGRPWNRSEVTAVDIKSPGCVDPHNVPGTLGSLVSCSISSKGQSTWESAVAQDVLPTCSAALESLSTLNAKDARLEIECPFGWLTINEEHSAPTRERAIFEPLRIPAALLQRLAGGMPDIPQWEIHFVAEPRSSDVSSEFSIAALPAMIERHGVDIEQTIQYRSAAMLRSGDAAYKYISTSYYPTPADVVSEANRLFDRTPLSEELWAKGFKLTLILEHIIGCFQPIDAVNAVHDSHSVEVKGAH